LGIVQRQGLRNTLISYAGLAIGFVNTTVVLPRLLTTTQVGFTGILVSLATIGAQLVAFGFPSMAMRYFPYFRGQGRGHSGFLALLLGLPMLGFVVAAALFWLGKPLVLHWYAKDAALLDAHYFVAVGMAGCILLYSLQDAFLKALYHTAFSSFVQEVLLRVLIVAAAAAYGAGWLSFSEFILAYFGAYATMALLLTVYLAAIGELHIWPTRAVLRVRPLREMLGYGGFALLNSISGTILLTIDNLMVGAKLSLAAAGIYLIATNISTALTMPFRALNKTAFPLIAEYWKEGALDKLSSFYRRTTRLNTLVGCYLALGIGLNLDFIYGLINRPAYATASVAVLLLLLGRLIDGIAGVNGIIVVTSPRYRYDLAFNFLLALGTIVLNWLLIPRLGLLGAAVAYCLALTAINAARTWFVWRAYGLQPFDSRVPRVLAVAIVAAAAVMWLPTLPNLWLNLLWRGGVLTVVYGAGVLLTRTAPELEAVWAKLRK